MRGRSIRAWAAALCCLLAFFAVGCGGKETEVVGTCGADPILREEYDYLVARLGGEETDAAVLREAILPSVLEDRAILAAADALLGLGAEDSAVKDAVDEGIEAAIESYGGKSAYRSALKEQSLTEHHLRRMLAIAELQRRAQEKLFAGTELADDKAFAEWLKDTEHHARAERFTFSDSATAETFRAAVAAGEDAERAAARLGGGAQKKTWYFLGLGGDAVDGAVFSLPADGTSLSAAVALSDGTFTVFRRFSVSETDRDDMVAMQGLAVRDRLRDLAWEQLLATYAEGLSVVWY